MKAFKYFIVLLFVTSCGTHVDYDFEKNTDFYHYKTYDYFTDIKTGFSQLDNKRLFRAIDVKLQSMGFTKSENPSFRVDIQSGEILNNNNNSNVGIGAGGVGGGVSIGFPNRASTTQRQISIEFVDDSKNGVFWQAVTTLSQHANNTPEKREAAIVKMIENIFSKYPQKQ